ncbi:MAG: tryptophan-rich sensory protein [candidate division KSB1 bacterium]|nr:tryptophan-rich sensory protein [candidate division KSB1 bacterium]MDZ7378205.1 tryptophan-rich sensory protein [candidate division KSB1 bacterium]MDZ7385028.1 tryptophan-rich sensory protein [candidate division KSB1 bacterium]MDZ7393365.1 tryptophan-rich sensory protein [candidate division KSB1 bacterium]MDZ7414298.1 tryptophan-rich sensory protein [candidate division KSB1 bacterium]
MEFSKSFFLRLVVGVGVCLLAGIVGGVFTRSAVQNWYPTLAKPVFTPPSWLFGPVWTVLYVLMGIAIAMIWHKSPGSNAATVLFLVQLVFNVLWSLFFFGLRSPAVALVDILLLWGTLLATLLAFWRILPVSGILLMPYLLWVSYAAVLNASIVYLNR